MRLVAQRQTDAVVAASHVPVDGPAALFQCARDRFLKRVGVAGVLRCSVERVGLCRGGLTALRKLQEIAKQPDARSTGLTKVKVSRADRAEDDHLLPRACDGNVEPSLTASAVHGAEVHRQFALGIATVADGEHHGGSLVALHCLQVLDEDRLRQLQDRGAHALVSIDQRVEEVLHQVLLRDAERNDAKRAVRGHCIRRPQSRRKLRNHRLRLGAVGARLGAVVRALHHAQRDAEQRVRPEGRRKRLQPAAVDVRVTECDQPLVSTAVVPAQHELREPARNAFVKQALQFLKALVVFRCAASSGAGLGIVAAGTAIKEASGRKLLGIAHHHGGRGA